MTELPKRKNNRLQNYDYSQNGAYFITVCTKDRKCLFGNIVGAVANRPPHIELSDIGKIAEEEIFTLQNIRENVIVEKYVIMPNHIHMVLVVDSLGGRFFDGRFLGGRLTSAPTAIALTTHAAAASAFAVSEIIRLWKRAISRRVGFSLWQKSFYDHVIRDEDDYLNTLEYIDNNPLKWELDYLYQEK
ncbi:hypothetical protein FACS1894104_2920 [Actinomycetota bacterium]|nr:hypothetical protein FACS1894104_2920 [Actinomycetota bacterium]